jgi:hypothetical protein
MRAKAPGVANVGVGYDPANGLYPLTLDTQNDIVVTDKIGNAALAIGQDCPPERLAPSIIDPPNTEEEIFGGTPPPGASPVVPTPTPAGETPTPAGQTPTPGPETPTPADEQEPEVVPCPTDEADEPDEATDSPEGESRPPPTADAGETQSATQDAEASPAEDEEAGLLCTVTPTTDALEIVSVDEGSDTGLVVGAVALLGLGTAAAGGGWYMFRRSRNGAA